MSIEDIKKFIRLDRFSKKLLLQGILFYLQYKFFFQFLPVKRKFSYLEKLKVKAKPNKAKDQNTSNKIFKILLWRLPSMNHCLCRAFVAFKLFLLVDPEIQYYEGVSLNSDEFSAHAWVCNREGSVLSDNDPSLAASYKIIISI